MPKPEDKFSKNVKFSRTKKFANSEGDIAKNEAALNDWKSRRKDEREQNKRVAAGFTQEIIVADEPRDIEEEEEQEESPSFYYKKMNLIVQNLPYDYSVSKLCKTFEQLGSILCVCTDPKESAQIPHEYYSAKIVPNEWNDLISAVQQDIFENGYSEYNAGNGVVCKIVEDPDQKTEDYGLRELA